MHVNVFFSEDWKNTTFHQAFTTTTTIVRNMEATYSLVTSGQWTDYYSIRYISSLVTVTFLL